MMKSIFITTLLMKALLGVLAIGPISSAYADIPLNKSNLQYDSQGNPRWIIYERGDYYLDIPESSFPTDTHTAIQIQASNVFLDGRGKTLTASKLPYGDGSNIIGVNVRGPVSNVTIKDLNVEKKYYGILFGSILNGRVENCTLTRNGLAGIDLWNSEGTTLKGNTANYNINGIVLDGDKGVVNRDNVIENNTVNYNTLVGIILHLENAYNTIRNNTANNNGHFGIQFPENSSCHDNIVSGNETSGNPTGILIRDSFRNEIKGNTITGNNDKGIWLYDASNNKIYDNYFNNPDKNVGFEGTCSGNQWNTSKTKGTNIMGGPYLGGNFWATPDKKGFSQITPDKDGDGICDSAYTFSGNVDQLPLHTYTVTITPPTVTTSAISFLSCDAASSGGNVTSSGNSAVTSRGVCWSISDNPTINDSHTSDGTGTGTFQSTITGLDLGATYYVRAYATNSAGTGYGQVLPYDTLPFEGTAYVSLADLTCGGHCPCYSTLQDAIDAPYDVSTIKIFEGNYNEGFVLDESRTILVEGEAANPTIKSPTVNSGSVTFRNLTIVP